MSEQVRELILWALAAALLIGVCIAVSVSLPDFKPVSVRPDDGSSAASTAQPSSQSAEQGDDGRPAETSSAAVAPAVATAAPATPATQATAAASSKASKTTTTAYTGMVNINTATKEQLCSLPGIGDVYAQRILDYRAQHGAFTSVDELLNVSGIGDKRLAKIRSRVTCS